MDLETAQTTTTIKLPILKQGEYDMWRLRIEQYFQVQDYALWDVIENGNSFKPAAQTTTNADGTSTSLIPGPVTTEEKVQKKNDVKARSMLLMALPNEHLMTFNQYKIAKTLFAAIQTRFGGNEATTKTLNTLLKKIQPNGSQLVHEDLEQIHENDLEEMDLKWQLPLLSMRTRRGPRNQDSRNRNQDSSRRTVNVEETSSKDMVAIDGAGFDWSYMANDEVPTNMALMAFSDSEFNKSEFNLATYKRGLASVEEQLIFYKKNELEKLKQEKESNQLKIENFDNASKRLFSPPTLNLFNFGLEEFQQPEFEGYGPKTSKSVSEDISNKVRESTDAPLVEELVSDDMLEKKTIFPIVAKIEFVRPKQQKKPVRKRVKYAEMYSFNHVQADCNYHQRERVVSGNNYTRVNYNYSAKKAHPSAHRNMASRAVLMKTGLRPLNNARTVNTAHPKTTIYSARPMSCFSKSAQSTIKRPCQIRTALTNKNFNQKVNTAKGKFYTARPKAVNTARPNSAVVNAVKALACWVWRPTKLNSASITLKRHNYVDARGISKSVMAWVPKGNKFPYFYVQGHPQKEDQGYVDSGCLRHMTENMSYLSDFKEFNGGYVTFGGGSKGGKITADESQVLLKVTRKNNMYSLDMKNIVPKESLTCLVAKATLDERGLLGHTQEDGIYYDEVFSLVARIEAIRLFLAYASFMGFMVYKMYVKSVFLYGRIKEEVVKELYGLHQASRAWYETLAKYLLDNGFHKGKIDQFLFIKKQKGDILLVQIYVDDIIFGSTKKELCTEFEKLVHDKFQMSSIGELTFFLGLQVKQKEDGIFINQDKYVADILRKFSFTDVRTTSTPMDTEKPLLKDSDGDDVDVHLYRSMIGSLMYLTSSRLDIMFAVCACARFQVTPKVSHLHAVKRIFRYLKGQPKLGLWYPRDSSFDLVGYSDSDYAGASLDMKSTTGGCQFLGCTLISWQCKKQTLVATSSTEAEYVAATSCCGQVLWIQNQMLDFGYNFMHTMINIDNNSTKEVESAMIQYEELGMTYSRIKSDEELAQRLQAEEREKYSEAEKSRCLQNYSTRERAFCQLRDEERRKQATHPHTILRPLPNRPLALPLPPPPSPPHMSNYIQHMEASTLQQWRSDVDQNSSKIAARVLKGDTEEELAQQSSKKQKVWVKESSTQQNQTEDKEIEIWVELKRLFEPDADDELWKSQKKTYACINMETMLVAKLLVEQNNEMSRELLRKIFMQIERPRR
ncbi:putative ribonuclease H-like domain-containing protein [Tanacetum coccineum]